MGALTRATREELGELSKSDPEWWADVFSDIASGCSLKEICEARGWAFGETWRTITENDELRGRYDNALRGRAEYVHEECIPIADGSKDAKLMVQERRKSAAVWNRERFGERVDHIGVMLDPLSEMLREISERRLAQMRAGFNGIANGTNNGMPEQVVTEVPGAVTPVPALAESASLARVVVEDDAEFRI